MGTVADSPIAAMPRGGPDASWLDRRLQTRALEFTDRTDVPAELRQRVIRTLDAMGSRAGLHEAIARMALSLVTSVEQPRILELGAGHGQLSAAILAAHPRAQVTVSDLDPVSVRQIAAGPLGSDRRVCTAVVDATDIQFPDASFDLVVFAMAFHHLPPGVACQAIGEATRVGNQFLVNDLKRPHPLALLTFPLLSVATAPVMALVAPPRDLLPTMHDGMISALRSYSPAALQALGVGADPGMRMRFLPNDFHRRFAPPQVNVVYFRPAGKPTE